MENKTSIKKNSIPFVGFVVDSRKWANILRRTLVQKWTNDLNVMFQNPNIFILLVSYSINIGLSVCLIVFVWK